MPKKLLFSVTMNDCEVQTFCSGGKGGQHQNKTESGVRIIHKASGAVGESRSDRSQKINKQLAFKRLTESKKFTLWLRMESARRMGEKSPEEIAEEQMAEKNIKTEVHDDKGRWVAVREEELK